VAADPTAVLAATDAQALAQDILDRAQLNARVIVDIQALVAYCQVVIDAEGDGYTSAGVTSYADSAYSAILATDQINADAFTKITAAVSGNDPFPFALEVVDGQAQTGNVSEVLALDCTVRILDQYGSPLDGQAVVVVTTLGGMESEFSPVGDSTDGVYNLGAPLLGATVGAQSMTASVDGYPDLAVVFTATGVKIVAMSELKYSSQDFGPAGTTPVITFAAPASGPTGNLVLAAVSLSREPSAGALDASGAVFTGLGGTWTLKDYAVVQTADAIESQAVLLFECTDFTDLTAPSLTGVVWGSTGYGGSHMFLIDAPDGDTVAQSSKIEYHGTTYPTSLAFSGSPAVGSGALLQDLLYWPGTYVAGTPAATGHDMQTLRGSYSDAVAWYNTAGSITVMATRSGSPPSNKQRLSILAEISHV